MENNNTIIFRMGEETGIVIEKTKEQFEHSLFKEQYMQAFESISHIMQNKHHSEADTSAANVVAFCGDRGEGKTSCMRSVLHILTDTDVHNAAQLALGVSEDLQPENNFALEMLDPSFFDDKHNIVELLLGQLYERVIQDNKRQRDNKFPRAKGYQELMSAFAEAQSCLSALAKKEDIYDSMNELSSLAASVRLRKSLADLFNVYLEYYGKKRLILCIDDLDLNMQQAYPMAENIRKYLCNDYCIILMSVKMEQLSNAILSAIRKDIGYANIVSIEQIMTMAHKYLTKFIPENNRILLPSPDDIVEKPLLILDRDGKKVDKIKENSVKETIVRLIFNKTRYLFYNSRSTSAIVPHNLRDMRQLIGILADMPDIFDGQQPRFEDILAKNKLIFKKYFNQSWVNVLSVEDKEFACQLVSHKDIISVNKFVVTYLGHRITDDKDIKIDGLFDDIIVKENRSHNISVGDVYYVIRQIETITTDKEINLLLFFIRSYYSMHLYELYDVITTTTQLAKDLTGSKTLKDTVRIYKYDSLYEGTNVLQKFLNGSYFTYAPGSLVNDRNEANDSPDLHRDIKAINGEKLGESIIRVNKIFHSMEEAQKRENMTPKYAESFKQEVQRCEYFILTTTHQLQGSKAERDRKAVVPPFIGEYDNIKKRYIEFDFLAIFYNLVNMRYAFGRFGDEGIQFFRYVLKEPWSLTSQLFMCVTNETKWPSNLSPHKVIYRYHRLLSDVCIRVSEVQQSIVEELTKKRLSNKHKEKGSNTYKLRWAYQDIQDLEISLYPYLDEEKEDLYKIPFNFLSPVMKYLEKEVEDDFNAIFMSGSTINNEAKAAFYAIFPLAKETRARKRSSIIDILRKNHPTLPERHTAFWNAILTQENYNNKSEWLYQCINNIEQLKKYTKTK